MLYLALILSGILFVAANVAARSSARPIKQVFGTGLCLSVLSCAFTGFILPLLTLLFCLILHLRRSRFLPLSTAAFIVVFALLSLPGARDERKYAELRAEFPYVSMEDRLPREASDREFSSSNFNDVQLTAMEERSEIKTQPRMRAYFLKSLHEETVSLFVNSPGFGQGRVINQRIPREFLTEGLRKEQPISQPAIGGGKLRSIDNPQSVDVPDSASAERLHQSSVVDFVHPAGWGYFKDRKHVAGFQSHQFSKVPEASGKLQVASVELIGWLRGEPMAYVSENLPSMKELRGAPTRPLDVFEEESLTKLRRGEEMVIKSEEVGVRLLGAIRATKQCIDCHGGQRGDLLGAFSYQLR